MFIILLKNVSVIGERSSKNMYKRLMDKDDGGRGLNVEGGGG